MTHVLVLSAKVLRDEQFKWAVMADPNIGYTFGPTFGFKNLQYFQSTE